MAYCGPEGLQSVQEKVKEVRKSSLGHASEMGDRVLQTLSPLHTHSPSAGPLLGLCEASVVSGPEKGGQCGFGVRGEEKENAEAGSPS